MLLDLYVYTKHFYNNHRPAFYWLINKSQEEIGNLEETDIVVVKKQSNSSSASFITLYQGSVKVKHGQTSGNMIVAMNLY